LHLVGSSILLYLIDDARTNKNQVHISRLCSDLFFGTKNLLKYFKRINIPLYEVKRKPSRF